ncbi:hypothetical protein [Pseudomonas nitroreducens]|uniref:hypothetical protein n=1 Tax=Pseudomonas nitroreducens TaxID=46680 RepID=UPI0026583AB7|nr:hypothetical protein [Pseudomonas nitroreducens]MCP1650053.1 hypothetical protein [Pseudomonas nitroreducens]MCP1688078.1 hypothetical protein [Pseudomonas nitroreducens]
MTWKTVFLGSESPSKERLTWVIGMYVALAMFAFGAITDFVPAPGWHSSGTSIAIAVTVVGTLAFYVCLVLGRIPTKAGASAWRKWLAGLIVPPVLFFVIWLGVVRGAGDLYSRWIGRSIQIEAVLTKEHFNSRRGCDYRLEGPVLRVGFPNYLCVNRGQFAALPQSASYHLVGRSSGLGFHIDEIRASSGEQIFSPLDALVR